MGSKVGITGGAGYVGSSLAKRLVDEGFEVRVIDNFSYSGREALRVLEDMNVEVVEGDILNDRDIDGFLDGVQFVYHLASIANVAECSKDIERAYRLNVLSTYRILDKIKGKDDLLGFFFPSSIAAIYGEPEYSPVDEKHPVKPIHDYGVLKRSSELFCQSYWRRYGVPIVIGRQSNVYGPSPKMKFDSVVHIFVKNVVERKNITIYGSGDQRRNFIFLQDLVDAYSHVLDRAIQGQDIFGDIYNFAGDEALVGEVAKKVTDLGRARLGVNVTVEHGEGRKEALGIGLRVSVEKARMVLGWAPGHSLDQGIEETFDYVCRGLVGEHVY